MVLIRRCGVHIVDNATLCTNVSNSSTKSEIPTLYETRFEYVTELYLIRWVISKNWSLISIILTCIVNNVLICSELLNSFFRGGEPPILVKLFKSRPMRKTLFFYKLFSDELHNSGWKKYIVYYVYICITSQKKLPWRGRRGMFHTSVKWCHIWH